MRGGIQNALDLGIVQRGDHGATITVVGIPASDNFRSASSRRGGVEARGSMVRANLGSSVVTEIATVGEVALRHPRQDVDITRHQAPIS